MAGLPFFCQTAEMAQYPTPRELEIEELLRNSQWLQELARSLVGDAFTAEDLLQEALSHAKNEAKWATGHLGGWVAGIVRNLAKQHFRKESRRIAREQEAAHRRALAQVSPGEIQEAPDPAYLAQKLEMQQILAQHVLALDLPSREVLLLRYYGDRSVKQIAVQLNLDPQAVETRLRRGRTRLRAQLEKTMGREQWALACLPLLPGQMAPPPPPVPIVPTWLMATAAAGVLLLVASLAGWLPWQESAPLSQEEGTKVTAADFLEAPPSALEGGGVKREPLDNSPVEEVAAPLQKLRFHIFERGSEAPMPGLTPKVYFARLATLREQEAPNHPQFFLMKSKVYWILEEQQKTSDEQGIVTLALPAECTEVILDLALHTQTHSLGAYARGHALFSLATLASKEIPLEMVPRNGMASGRVQRPDGEPVPFAKVDLIPTVLAPRDKSVATSIEADASGHFLLDQVASGTGGFVLAPRLDGYLPVRQLMINGNPDTDPHFEDIVLELAPAVAVTVAVQDGNGAMVSGAVVQTMDSLEAPQLPAYPDGHYQSAWTSHAISSAEGLAKVTVPESGKALYLVTATGFAPWQQEYEEPPAVVPAVLESGVSVRVSVTADGQPIAEAQVRMVSEANLSLGEWGRQMTTNGQGVAEFESAHPGEVVEFTVLAAGYELFLSRPTEILAHGQELAVNLQPGLSLTGQVVDWQALYPGRGVPMVYILPIDAKGWPWDGPIPEVQRRQHRLELASADQIRVGAESTFRFEHLAPGRYRLWFGKRHMPYGMMEVSAGEQDVVLSPFQNAHTAPLFYGTVRNALTLEPVTDFRLVQSTYSEQGQRLKGNRGQLRFPMKRVLTEDGSFRLMAFQPGWYSLAAWAPQGGYVMLEPKPKYFGEGEHEIEFLLHKSTEGRLLIQDQTGHGLEGAEVHVFDGSGSRVLQMGTKMTDFREFTRSLSDGSVVLSAVPATGDFHLEIRHEGRVHVVSGSELRASAPNGPLVITL